MSLFDLRTAYLVMGLLYLLMPAIVWFALRGSRSDAVLAWCLGGFGLGLGIFVIATRGLAPEWFSLGVGNALASAGLALRVGACRRELGLPVRGVVIGLAVAAAMGLYEFFRAYLGELKVASTWVTLLQGALAANIAALSMQLARRERSSFAALIGITYALLALSLFSRVAGLFQGWGNPNVWLNPLLTADLVFMSIAGIIVAVVSNVGYLGMYFERVRRSEVASAAEQAAREASGPFAAQIASLERHRSLGLVAMSLSHELTQPLAAIAVQARVAQRAGTSPGGEPASALGQALDRIVESAMRAGAIVERIRSFIRPVSTKPEPLELAQLARDVAALIEADARAAGIAVRLPDPGQSAWVSGDRISLSQVVLNAYRNALEASAETLATQVQVTVLRQAGRALLRVRDFGPGLSESALRQAGEPLFTTKPEGLGVGLTVSRAIAEQHGGSITLSNADGGGAAFELSLPARELGGRP